MADAVVDQPAAIAGRPDTVGLPQRAADAAPQLSRGSGVHAPDTAVDAGRIGALDVRAASVRGTYARYTGAPRQDDYALGGTADGAWLVVAVADGLSSATAGHLGAALAARTAVQQAERALADGGRAALDVDGVLQSAAYQLRRAAEPLLERAGQPVTAEAISGLFATTLVLAVLPTAPGDVGLVARVGDSGAWSLARDGRWTPVLPAREPGAVVTTATAALPALPAAAEQVEVVLDEGTTLVLATDGVTDPMGGDGTTPVGRYLAACWAPGLPEPLEFARQIAFRGRSWDDDRTAVAVRPAGAGAAPIS